MNLKLLLLSTLFVSHSIFAQQDNQYEGFYVGASVG